MNENFSESIIEPVALHDALLPKLLSGEIDVSALEGMTEEVT